MPDTEESPTQATAGALLTMSAGKARRTRDSGVEDGEDGIKPTRLDVDAEGDERMLSEDDQYSASVPEGQPVDADAQAETADTTIVCRRRVPVSCLNGETSLYTATRQWLFQELGGSVWAPPNPSLNENGEAHEELRLPPPKPHNRHTLARLKPMQRLCNVGDITRRPATGGVGRQQLLFQHVNYARKIRRWNRMAYGFRLLRYKDRLAALLPYEEGPEPEPGPELEEESAESSNLSEGFQTPDRDRAVSGLGPAQPTGAGAEASPA